MHGKEFMMKMISTYFTLVTMITVAMLILGLYFAPDESFGYIAFASPLLYGACGLLPSVVMYSKRELTVKELLIRKIIQFVLIEIIILAVAFQGKAIDKEQKEVVISMGISVFIIFVLAHAISWFQDYMSARRMTEDLIKFQENIK